MLISYKLKERNCWTVSAKSGKNTVTIAEVKLTEGQYVTVPFKKLTESESAGISVFVLTRRLNAVDDPERGSIEARLGKMDEMISSICVHLDELGWSPEWAKKLDEAATLLEDVRDAMRLTRGTGGKPEWEPMTTRKAA